MTNLETNTTDARSNLNEYLEKPLELETGQLSTQVNLSATSLSSGGIEGLLLIRKNGKVIVQDSSTNRILLGTQKGGF